MWVRVVVAIVLFLLPKAVIAQTEKRLALLIGNQSYGGEIGRLANPHNDIALLESALKGLGFEVTTVRDAGLGSLHQVVNAYARQVQAAGPNAVGFFYYSGHGAADAGVNYLIPIDVKTTDTGELWDQSLRLTEITRKLKTEAGNATHFVVFDACRNTLKLTRTGSRALVQSKGFAPVAQESGMLIAYATAEGELASDVGSEAGPYASVLAEEIIRPGFEAVTMFRNVQRRVRTVINQEPYLGFNALGDVYLAGAPNTQAPARLSEAAEAWDRTRNSADVGILETFVAHYDETFYADLARARIKELKKQSVAGVATQVASPSSFDGEWTGVRNGGSGCKVKEWRFAVLIEGTNIKTIGYKKMGRLTTDGNFEFYIPGLEDDYAVVVGKVNGDSGAGSYKYKTGVCSGTITLQRSHPSGASEAWDATKDSTNIAALEAFIAQYKDTSYADLARVRLEELSKQRLAVATPGPSLRSAETGLDGDWDVTISCNAMKGVLPYVHHYSVTIMKGSLHGRRGTKGMVGSTEINGKISKDGTGLLTVDGTIASPEATYKHLAKGSYFSYPVSVRLEGTSGTGRRTDGLRDCGVTLSKQ
jgi:hypothetical protein